MADHQLKATLVEHKPSTKVCLSLNPWAPPHPLWIPSQVCTPATPPRTLPTAPGTPHFSSPHILHFHIPIYPIYHIPMFHPQTTSSPPDFFSARAWPPRSPSAPWPLPAPPVQRPSAPARRPLRGRAATSRRRPRAPCRRRSAPPGAWRPATEPKRCPARSH